MYQYGNLSDFEFELLCRDIMERKLGCPLRCFAPGRDGGVDITETKLSGKHMVQVKHYIDRLYRTLLSMKESPYMVLSLITRQFRLILETMLLTQNGLTQEQIAARLELREFAVKEYQRQSKRFPVAGWKQAVRDCLQADLDIKSGRAAEETAVELLIMKYAA